MIFTILSQDYVRCVDQEYVDSYLTQFQGIRRELILLIIDNTDKTGQYEVTWNIIFQKVILMPNLKCNPAFFAPAFWFKAGLWRIIKQFRKETGNWFSVEKLKREIV